MKFRFGAAIPLMLVGVGIFAHLWLARTNYPLPQNNTLVIFLAKYPQDNPDLTGAKTWLDHDLARNIARMSFNRDSLNFTYVGPYVGAIENCTKDMPSGVNRSAKITAYSLNRAYRAGIDVSQYNYFLVLRSVDFWDDDECVASGNGWFSPSLPYEGGVLTEVGASTTGPNVYFYQPDQPIGEDYVLHEFLHGYGRGSQHTTVLHCFTTGGTVAAPAGAPRAPQNWDMVPYYYAGDEDVIESPYCVRGGPSVLDLMGIGRLIEVNSILKKQYGWLPSGNIATVEGAALSAGQTFKLRPLETSAAPNEAQMIVIPIAGTQKAYVLELRGNPRTPPGVGVYLYLMPNRHKLDREEQYLLFTGDFWNGDHPAPMRLGETTIDSKMNLKATITNVSNTGAVLKVSTAP
jgi:hypothetical protein